MSSKLQLDKFPLLPSPSLSPIRRTIYTQAEAGLYNIYLWSEFHRTQPLDSL